MEYQQTKKDYTDFYKAYCLSGLKKRLWAVIILLFIAIIYFGRQPIEWPKFLIGITASAVVIFGIYYLIPLLNSLIKLNKVLAKEGSALGKKKLIIMNEGLLIESESVTKTWLWEAIASANVLDGFIYLILADKRMLLFPKRHFQSDNEAINFLGMVQNKLPYYNALPKVNFRQSTKPSYYWGLLCLIPFVGALIGFFLLFVGVLKYKDKWLILIGTGGILLSATLWSTYFYSDTFGFKTVLIQNSQRQLNGLMKAIEFYKMKNGVYPDSLKQINNDNSEFWIYDPLQAGEKANKSNEYNYEKVGNNYYLFSSGIDGIPNTSDDIYPQVAKNDSGKFGLIHK